MGDTDGVRVSSDQTKPAVRPVTLPAVGAVCVVVRVGAGEDTCAGRRVVQDVWRDR